MGNKLSRPHRPPKERPMAYLRRKLGKMTRKDRIFRMVSLTFLKDEAKLHQFAEWAKLTSNELRIYYEKIDSIVGEFNTDIPEVEFRYSPEMTSDSDTSAETSDSSDNALEGVITVDSPVYSDPVKQKNFEQFCLAQYGTQINVHQKEGTNNTSVNADMADIVSHKTTVSGDTKHSNNDVSNKKGNIVNSSGTRKRRSPRIQKKSPRRQKKSVKVADKAQVCVTPESKEALMIPKFNSPSRQPVLHTPVTVVPTDITLKTWNNVDDDQTNEQTDQPPTVVHHSPDTSLSKPTKDMSNVTQKKSHVKKAYPKSSADQDAKEATTCNGPAKQPVLHTPVPPPKASCDNPQPDESKEIPIFSSSSKQRVLHTPVQLVVREPLPDTSADIEKARLPSVADEAHFKPKITSTAREHIKQNIHSDSSGHPTSIRSDRQPESVLLSPVANQAHCEPNITSTVRPTEEQGMHSQSFGIPVSDGSERKPVSQQQEQLPTKQNISHASPLQDASKEVPILKSPSKQMIVHTPVPIIARVTDATVANPEAEKVPVSKGPSKQMIVHTPVPTIARVTDKAEEIQENKEVPIFLSPSRQPVLNTPAPIIAKENSTGSHQADLLRSPVPRLDLPFSPDDINVPIATDSPDSSLQTPNTDGRSRSQASLKRQAKLPGKINQGLLTKTKAQAKAKVPKRKIPEQPIKNLNESPSVDAATAVAEKGGATKNRSSPKKPGFIKRCVDNLKRKTESALSNNQVIKVKPATPECTIENHEPVKSQPSHLKSVRRKVVKKRVISQTNLRPDKGIVWPTEFETLNAHNKSYYVEQFLRSELFKQRCKRKQKGGTSWMNGLTKFQLWVVEHEGTDAIEAVLNPVKKNKSDAKAKVQCWRVDSPEC